MQTKTHLTLALMAFAMLQAASALAVDLDALPPVQTENGITYLTGGGGQPESIAMKAVAGRYSLALTFAERSGDFVDIKVSITDRRGDRVLDSGCGPILPVDLPAGWCKVQAQFDGTTLVRTVEVSRGHHHELAYAWPNDIGSGSELTAFEALPTEQSPPPQAAANLVAPPAPLSAAQRSDGVIRHWDPLIYDSECRGAQDALWYSQSPQRLRARDRSDGQDGFPTQGRPRGSSLANGQSPTLGAVREPISRLASPGVLPGDCALSAGWIPSRRL
jgi:hypothetical protein